MSRLPWIKQEGCYGCRMGSNLLAGGIARCYVCGAESPIPAGMTSIPCECAEGPFNPVAGQGRIDCLRCCTPYAGRKSDWAWAFVRWLSKVVEDDRALMGQGLAFARECKTAQELVETLAAVREGRIAPREPPCGCCSGLEPFYPPYVPPTHGESQ